MIDKIESLFSYLRNTEKLIYLFSFFSLIVCNIYLFISNKRILKFKNSQKKKGERSILWQHYLIRAAQRPFQLAFLLLLTYFIATIFLKKYSYSDTFRNGTQIVLLFLMIWVLFKFLKDIESDFASYRKQKLDSEEKTNVEGFFLFAKIFILFIALLITLQIFDVNVSSILAIGGIGGILFGLATRSFFESLFSGMLLFIDRKFEIGDFIKAEKNIEGTVEHISSHSTLIRHIDQSLFSIPNQEFTQLIIRNFSHMTHQLLQIKIPIRYEDFNKLEDLLKEIDIILRNQPQIDTKKDIRIFLEGFENWALNILIQAYIELEGSLVFEQVRHEIYLKILKMIQENDASIYTSTSKVYITPSPKDGLVEIT